MKEIAREFTEKLQALNFPSKDNYSIVIVRDASGNAVVSFGKKNNDEIARASQVLSCGADFSSMAKKVKDMGYKWTEKTTKEYFKLLTDYANSEEKIWSEFEQAIKSAYLPPTVSEEVQDKFYQGCWEYAKARSEDMSGIEELFEKFSEYVK